MSTPRKETVGHAFNGARTKILTALQDGLLEHERTGIDEGICDRIRVYLGCLPNLATEIERRDPLGKPIYLHMQNYETVYREWNAINGDCAKAAKLRHLKLIKLRKRRSKLAVKCANHAHVLAQNCDLELLDATHRATKDLVQALPESFVALAKALERLARQSLWPKDDEDCAARLGSPCGFSQRRTT